MSEESWSGFASYLRQKCPGVFINPAWYHFLDSTGYGVAIEPVVAPAGAVRWQAIGVRHLSPTENMGKHNVFVEVLDEQEAS